MGRPAGNRKTARLTVSLDADDYANVVALARDQDVSVAWLVRRAIKNALVQDQAERHLTSISISSSPERQK